MSSSAVNFETSNSDSVTSSASLDVTKHSDHSEASTVKNTHQDEEEFINEYLRPVTVVVSDGNTFKTVIGDQPMTPGGRYFFEVQVNSGFLLKIGICRKDIDPNCVSGETLISDIITN